MQQPEVRAPAVTHSVGRRAKRRTTMFGPHGRRRASRLLCIRTVHFWAQVAEDVALAGLIARPRPAPATRTCTDRGAIKAIAEFTPIAACRSGWYGRCRKCRARRGRERYWADPAEREAQKARVRRNKAAKSLVSN